MKKQKNWIMVMIIAISAMIFGTSEVISQSPRAMYGGKLNLNGIPGSENAFGVYLAGEAGMGVLPTATDNKPIWFIAGYVGPSFSLGDIRLNLAAGYEQNLTYQRGQYAALIGLSGDSWSLEGVKLFPSSQILRKNHPGNFVISGSWYPNAGSIGIGAFFQREYECNYVGAKLSIRIGSIGGGSSPFYCGY